jgi:hypothetical protein
VNVNKFPYSKKKLGVIIFLLWCSFWCGVNYSSRQSFHCELLREERVIFNMDLYFSKNITVEDYVAYRKKLLDIMLELEKEQSIFNYILSYILSPIFLPYEIYTYGNICENEKI